MRFGLRVLRRMFERGSIVRKPSTVRPVLETLEDRLVPSTDFVQTNLVSDVPGLAQVNDPNLVNAWGLVAGATSPWWVADQGSGKSTLYNGQGQPQQLVVTIPNSDPSKQGSPTGIVNNSDTSAFLVDPTNTNSHAIFIFATTDGTISGWNPGVNLTHSVIEATSTTGAVYTGLAIGKDANGDELLYAADFKNNKIDVYGSDWKLVTSLAGSFHDAKLPSDYRVFNIQNINGKLYVEYAPFDPATGGVQPGKGNGAVDVFNTDGQLQQRLIHGGKLDDPWGITMAPAGFGRFSNDLLVGNFGSGNINAFDPQTGKWLGELRTSSGQPFDVQHLWALQFGNGSAAGPSNTLFFTAGLTSHFGAGTGTPHGLFGSLQAVTKLSDDAPILSNLSQGAQQTFSTVPANGDVNPYGVAFVPKDFRGGGQLAPGDILVSNFNNSANVQGTGSTIVKITPDGQHSVFFQGPSGLGLTTALAVLPQGFVLVGSAPATTVNGTNTVGNGALLILDSNGNEVGQISDSSLLQGPWDMTIGKADGTHAEVFVSNVLSGTVTRLDLRIPRGGIPMVQSETQIASGYAHRTDPGALVVGPTGLAFDARTDKLYVTSTADNAIYAIANADSTEKDQGTGRLVIQGGTHLHGPLGLVLAPNGDLIVANGDAVNADPTQSNELVEFTPHGQFVTQLPIDGGAPGAAFGLAAQTIDGQLRFAAVDDDTNTLHVWTFQTDKDDHHRRDRDD